MTPIIQGDQLFAAGRYQEAQVVYQKMLNNLGDRSSYESCITLSRLGRCLSFQGQSQAKAMEYYQQALAIARELESSSPQYIDQQIGVLLIYLGDILRTHVTH